jgi:hypothetical protein
MVAIERESGPINTIRIDKDGERWEKVQGYASSPISDNKKNFDPPKDYQPQCGLAARNRKH